jgi:hypothetical protein
MLENNNRTRRLFLTQCSTLALAGSFLPATALASSAALRETSLQSISFGQFSAQEGTVFRVRQNANPPLGLILVAATPKASAPGRGSGAEDTWTERFSLLFLGPIQTPLEQETYTFEHPRLGRFAMFIVPLHSSSGDHCYYEAVFNRVPVRANRRSL